MKVQWTKDLTKQTYKDALTIRKRVFIDEQKVPKEIELDEKDQGAIHFVGYLNNKAVATGRIIEEKTEVYTLQRLATLKDYRGNGYGAILLQDIEKYIKNNDGKKIILDAQDSAITFYELNDYLIEGEGYIKADIPHHSMSKTFN